MNDKQAARQRAIRILRESYGSNPGVPLSEEDRRWLESHLTHGSDTILDAAQRIAGDTYNWRAEPSWTVRAQHFRFVG